MNIVFMVLGLILAAVLLLLLWPLRKQRIQMLSVALYFIITCFSLYFLLGSPQMVPLMEARSSRLAELKTSITQYSDQVKNEPKNLEAWVSLGQAFIETGQYEAAANAFKQSVLISAGNPALILAYAKSMVMAADGKVSDHAKKSFEMVLLQDSKNAEARYYLILRKLQDGDNEHAMKEMKTLYRELSEDSPLKAQINRQIGRD